MWYFDFFLHFLKCRDFFFADVPFCLCALFQCALYIIYLPGKRKKVGREGSWMLVRRVKPPWKELALRPPGPRVVLAAGQRSGHSLRHLFARCCWSCWLDECGGVCVRGGLESWSIQPQPAPASYPGQTTASQHFTY